MTSRRPRICTFCEATCGLTVELENDTVVDVVGDHRDPFSCGYRCSKAAAIADVHVDGDRLRGPVKRVGSEWIGLSWEQAFTEIGDKLANVRRRYSDDAVAVYLGNPIAFDYATVIFARFLLRSLCTANSYSASSLDGLPHMVTSYLMFGHQLLLPVPDIDNTDMLLIIGANPVVSNGSIVTAPGIQRRLLQLRRRNGTLAVVDPRRTETASLADLHLPISPGTDGALLLAVFHVIFRYCETHPCPGVDPESVSAVRRMVRDVDEHVAARVTGLSAQVIADVARNFAAARRAVCYGRLGVAHQPFGTVVTWLINVLNAITGNLDAASGAMFTTPAVDLVALGRLMGERGGFGPPTRVRGLPSFGGERPVATLADEIEQPGAAQVRALLTVGGNLTLSAPDASRLSACIEKLDVFVAVDPYLNETTCRAHYVLPPARPLTRDQYPLVTSLVEVRNIAKYMPAAVARSGAELAEWEILNRVHAALARSRSGTRGLMDRAVAALTGAMGPLRLLDLGLKAGPYGLIRSRTRLSVASLSKTPSGVDLGPLRPMLSRHGVRIRLAPQVLTAELARLLAAVESAEPPRSDELILVGRRQRHSSNTWLHNSTILAAKERACTLLLPPMQYPGAYLRVRECLFSQMLPPWRLRLS